MTLRDAQRFFRWYSIGYFACGLYEVLSPTRGLDNYSIPLKKQANSRRSRTAQRIHNLRVRPFRAQQVDYLISNKCLNQTTINGIDMV